MTDLISRQAAIDALAKFVPYAICDASTESYTNGLTDAYNLICQLPSAQPEMDEWCEDCKEYDTEKHCCPRWNRVIRDTVKEMEIIRCKDCRFYRPMADQDDLCTYRNMQVFDDDFCSRAERRTDETD